MKQNISVFDYNFTDKSVLKWSIFCANSTRLVGASQTAHFEMNFSMSLPLIGVIMTGMGSSVLSQ